MILIHVKLLEYVNKAIKKKTTSPNALFPTS